MEKLREPLIKDIELEKIILKRLKHHPEHREDFINYIANDISTLYDETTINYAKSLVEIDSKGSDNEGFFTLGKEIWIIVEKESNEVVGYEVITRKRGGSIKLGPTYIKKAFRGKGYASECDLGLFDMYAKEGARKVYLTAPVNDMSSAKLDFKKLGLRLEALLYKHYSTNFSERIVGKFLNNEETETNNLVSIDASAFGNKRISKIVLNNFDNIDNTYLKELIIKEMSENFDNIDEDFVNNLLKHSIGHNNAEFEKKTKDFYCIFEKENLVGLCAGTLKRGGTYKIIPFILKDDYINDKNLDLIFKEIERQALNNNRKKITFFIPVQQFSLINLFSNRYISEGILKAPYKKNRDIVIFSKFI